MPYDDKFFEAYREYLKEPLVRTVHDSMFRVLEKHLAPLWPRVLDLGCGVGEFANFYNCKCELNGGHAYFGVDLQSHGSHCSAVADYTKELPSLPFNPNCFISLFSVECCLDANSKYGLYNRAFKDLPSVSCALVSGFYYRSRASFERVQEVGGIESYQTIEQAIQHPSSVFSEFRNTVAVPSKMFGDDVVEVWKLLVRN